MHQLVLIRHGESVWNRENRFTGWEDIDLSEQGLQEARQAGILLSQQGFDFDVAYTSKLTRAIRTLWEVLDQMQRLYIPVHKTWRLNERHYGMLQGLNKADTVAQYGEAQVKIWRRAYAIGPEPMPIDDPKHPRFDPRYADVDPSELLGGECLKDTLNRLLPCWHESIAPAIHSGKRVVVAAHGNSLRALIKALDGVSDDDIVALNIPNGKPLIYELDRQLKPIRHYYLGDA